MVNDSSVNFDGIEPGVEEFLRLHAQIIRNILSRTKAAARASQQSDTRTRPDGNESWRGALSQECLASLVLPAIANPGLPALVALGLIDDTLRSELGMTGRRPKCAGNTRL